MNFHPLDANNVITIAPSVTTGAVVSGVSRCCITALSPETGGVGDSQLGGSFGPIIKRAGYDAIIIIGKAAKPSYLMVDDERVKIKDASHLWSKTILEVHDALIAEHGKANLSILQCGPAGEQRVCFACIMGDLNNVADRTGMGAVFGSKNLLAVVVRGNSKIEFADEKGLKTLAKLGTQRLAGSGFPETLQKYGTPGVLGAQVESGNMATHNFSRSWHKNYQRLDGAFFEPHIGAGSTTCFGCSVRCWKRVKFDESYQVTNRLSGPEFETLGLLGSNLDITDPKAIAKANELCNNFGLDTISTGGVAAYLFECLERELISNDEINGKQLGFNDPEGLFWLIEQIASRQGIGDIMAKGLTAAVARFGDKTAPFAICVKNKVPAVHMAQVKPSQALMYAVCPIGADHMSSEHDWLLSSEADVYKALYILGNGGLDYNDLNKVRMTVYSQYYYSLRDALCLCFFCWGCGSLFSYDDLLELIRCSTGWESSMWGLMKAGERRINMLRQINALRGFTRKEDKLPERLFESLPDGPTKGRSVDAKTFPVMLEQYNDLMGWDKKTGNPLPGKLLELGLDWMIS